MMRTWMWAAALCLTLIGGPMTLAQAQPADAQPADAQPANTEPANAEPADTEEEPGPASPPSAEDLAAEKKDEARRQFMRGFALQGKSDFSSALAAFLHSRELYPTRNATNNAAVCLVRLDREPEALVMFETLLKEFPELSLEDRRATQKEIQRLRGLVGSVEVSDAPIGAQIVIDGQNVGEAPLLSPVRVHTGSHVVSVYMEGYAPFSKRVEVAGGQTVSVPSKLTALLESGTLVVSEASGGVLDVLVDGAVVGKSPWRGRVGVGRHLVTLQGAGDLGSSPANIEVKAQQIASLELVSKKLESELSIQAKPPGALVRVDAVEMGRGGWAGRLERGSHRVEITLDGFLIERRELELEPGHTALTIELERDPDAEMWRLPSKIVFDASAAFAVSPTFGGEVSDACEGDCAAGAALGFVAQGFIGYELGSGWGFGGFGGYLFAEQGIEGRAVNLQPQGLSARSGSADERLQLSGGMLGATASYHFGELPTVLARLGAGVLFASVGDKRDATLTSDSDRDFAAPELVSNVSVPFLVIAPELRAGIEVTDGLELGAGLTTLVLIALDTPRWGADDERPVVHPDDGYGSYSDEALVGSALLFFAPGLFARYAL